MSPNDHLDDQGDHLMTTTTTAASPDLPHKGACPRPEPETTPARMRGWVFLRCPACGAGRLTRLARTTASSKEN